MTSVKPYRQSLRFANPWSREEDAALERFVQGRIKGKYRNCRQAARAYLAEVEESRNGTEGRVTRRSERATSVRIWKQVGDRKWATDTSWSPEELRVLDHYVRRLARVSGRTMNTVLPSCASALRRLHAAHPDAGWARQDRTRQATENKLRERGNKLNSRWAGRRWTPQETSLIASYALAVARGRFATAADAADPCQEKLKRLRSSDPSLAARRPLYSVAVRIRRAAQRLGWTRCWTPEELQSLEPYALGLVRGKYLMASEAAAAFQARPHPGRASKSGISHPAVARSSGALQAILLNRAKELGRPSRATRWTRKEAQRLDWYAGQVVKGRISGAAQAAREFMAERARLRRRQPGAPWLKIRRTEGTVHGAIWERARRLGWLSAKPAPAKAGLVHGS